MTIEFSSLEQMSSIIRERRKELGVSQKNLARMCRLSQSTIARIETDALKLNPSYLSVYYVVDALNRIKEGHREGMGSKRAKDIMHRRIIFVNQSSSIFEAIEVFKDYDFPQLPVLDDERHVIGTVYQRDLLNIAMRNPDAVKRRPLASVMKAPLPQVDTDSRVTGIRTILENSGGIIVVERGRAVGIITVYDILKTV